MTNRIVGVDGVVYKKDAVDMVVEEARRKNRKKNLIIEISLYGTAFIFFVLAVTTWPSKAARQLEEETQRRPMLEEREANYTKEIEKQEHDIRTVRSESDSIRTKIEEQEGRIKDAETRIDKVKSLYNEDEGMVIGQQSAEVVGLLRNIAVNRSRYFSQQVKMMTEMAKNTKAPMGAAANRFEKRLFVFALLGDGGEYRNGCIVAGKWLSADPSFKPRAVIYYLRTTHYLLALDFVIPVNSDIGANIVAYQSRRLMTAPILTDTLR